MVCCQSGTAASQGANVKLRIAVVVAGVAVTGLGVAAPAHAWPQPPPPNCEQRPMVSYCDGPVQADGSWQRCFDNQPMWNRGVGYIGGSNCYQTGPGPDRYPWAPQYHIGS